MKAVLYHRYGSPDVLRLEEVTVPVPKDDEVLVRIQAASANAADWHLMRADPMIVRLMNGVTAPRQKILGCDIAGRVTAVGKRVTRFRVGDEVFGDVSSRGWGGFAEYACADESALVHKPAAMTFEDAAAVPIAALTALQGLRDDGAIAAGKSVLITGASGGVGTYAVQIAKVYGAEVTAVCSTRNEGLVRALGADHVVDYTREDFTKRGQRYDLIFAAAGDRSLSEYLATLTPGGRYVMAGGSTSQMFAALLLGPFVNAFSRKKVRAVMMKSSARDLELVATWMLEGKVRTVIDKRFALEGVPDAIRYLEEGHTQGKVVIHIADEVAKVP